MIDLKNLNIILTGATGIIGNSILDKLFLAYQLQNKFASSNKIFLPYFGIE